MSWGLGPFMVLAHDEPNRTPELDDEQVDERLELGWGVGVNDPTEALSARALEKPGDDLVLVRLPVKRIEPGVPEMELKALGEPGALPPALSLEEPIEGQTKRVPKCPLLARRQGR